jgi:hypothetical protein
MTWEPAVIAHLLEFRVVPGHQAEVAAFLRRFPAGNGSTPRMAAHCIGRRLGRDQQEYVLTTVWQDEESRRKGTAEDGLPVYLYPMLDLLERRSPLEFEVLASHWGDGFGSAKILRVYRADIVAEVLGDWTTMVEQRAERLAETAGLRVVLAGTPIPSGERTGNLPVVAVSAWRDWNAVLSATGGHIDQPVLETALGEFEKPGGVDHYQLLDRVRLLGEADEEG